MLSKPRTSLVWKAALIERRPFLAETVNGMLVEVLLHTAASAARRCTTDGRLLRQSGSARPKLEWSFDPASTDQEGRWAGVGKSAVAIGRMRVVEPLRA
jgi:hypothetical protein